MERKWVMIDEQFKNGDLIGEDVRAFDTREEAEREAWALFNHLTDAERKDREIYVAEITRDDLEDYAVDEETGAVDWTLVKQFNGELIK